ncbi:MAG: hypothetical protein ACREQQ_02000, partial [Candidatus Binatia bacterium]
VPDFIHQAFVTGAATGEFPDGSVPGTIDLASIFHAHSPASFAAAGHHLDIPVLLSQGMADNLFNLNEGWHNFEEVLTANSRSRSIFIGHNGGHALPNALPLGGGGGTPLTGGGGEACSGAILGDSAKNRTDLTIAFLSIAFAGGNPQAALGASRYNLTTPDGVCIRRATLAPDSAVVAGPVVATLAGVGAPLQIAIAAGPLTVAGIPRLAGKLTAAGSDVRGFFGLAVGTTPLDARVVQNNLMPIRANDPFPVGGPTPDPAPSIAAPIDVELPGVAVTVDAGETLYLTVSALSDMFAGFESRVPGVLLLEEALVKLPVVP